MRDTGIVVTSAASAALAVHPLRDELLVDTAINRLEKLRRVFALEEWIREAVDNPQLATATATWGAERAQLITELQLEEALEEPRHS